MQVCAFVDVIWFSLNGTYCNRILQCCKKKKTKTQTFLLQMGVALNAVSFFCVLGNPVFTATSIETNATAFSSNRPLEVIFQICVIFTA